MLVGRSIITFGMLLINLTFVTNRIEPLLIHVVGTRLPFILFPRSESIDRRAILGHAVMAERGDRCRTVAVRADEAAVIHRAFLRRRREPLRIRLDDVHRIRPALGQLAQYRAHLARACADDERWNHRHAPAAFRADDFHAVEIRQRVRAVRRALDAKRVNLFLHVIVGALLERLHALPRLLVRARQMNIRPRQKPRDRIQVACDHLAPEPRRFERNRPAAREAVADRQHVPEALLRQRSDERRIILRMRAAVRVDGRPRLLAEIFQFLLAIAIRDFFIIRQRIPRRPFDAFALRRRDALVPARRPEGRTKHHRQRLLVGHRVPFFQRLQHELHREFLPAIPEPFGIHAHEPQERRTVALLVRRRWQQAAENGRPHERQRFPPPPFPEPRDRLTLRRFPLLVAFLRQLADGELLFDER